MNLRMKITLSVRVKYRLSFLTIKFWALASVAELKEIQWGTDAFNTLELENDKKNLVRALVEGFDTEDAFEGFDDAVQGKGKGLIFLPHGAPGLGKTLTAGN